MIVKQNALVLWLCMKWEKIFVFVCVCVCVLLCHIKINIKLW